MSVVFTVNYQDQNQILSTEIIEFDVKISEKLTYSYFLLETERVTVRVRVLYQ